MAIRFIADSKMFTENVCPAASASPPGRVGRYAICRGSYHTSQKRNKRFSVAAPLIDDIPLQRVFHSFRRRVFDNNPSVGRNHTRTTKICQRRPDATGADVMAISSAEKTAVVERNASSPGVEELLTRFFFGMDIVLVWHH